MSFVVVNAPDFFVQAGWVCTTRWKEIDEEKMAPGVQNRHRLIDELGHGTPARLVAWRNDLDHRDDAIATGVPDGEDSTTLGITRRLLGLPHDTHFGRRVENRQHAIGT